jgi:diamine N-acetyltransferase
MTLLKNEDLELRALEPEDLDILYTWENDTHLWIHGNTLSPYSKLVLRQYISDSLEQDIYQTKQLRLMIVSKSVDRVIGTVDLYDLDFHNSRAGVGVLIDEKYRNKGYAIQTLRLISVYVFSFLRIKQLYAYIAVDNIKSRGLFEQAGYSQSGILINWVCCHSVFKDVYIYQLFNNLDS